jgi:hypothetical protein
MIEPVEPPPICVSSSSRGPGQRMEQDADVVIRLNPPDAFDRDDSRGGEADFSLLDSGSRLIKQCVAITAAGRPPQRQDCRSPKLPGARLGRQRSISELAHF